MDNSNNNIDFSDLISLDELGVDTNDIKINTKSWYDTTYEMYKDSCHSPRNQEERESMEKYLDAEKINEKKFSAWGKKCCFRWYALTVYFDESIHIIDKNKELHNKNHYYSLCDQLTANPAENIAHAINNEGDLLNILWHSPVVANIHDCIGGEMGSPYYEYLYDLVVRLTVFLNQGIKCCEVFKKNNKGLYIDGSTIKGKDVILPFSWANRRSLNNYGYLAKKCADNGANTVVGIFASRLAPTTDGREPDGIPPEYRPRSFNPRFPPLLF